MRIDWLEDLLAVLDSASLSDAAQMRFLTQPAFSRRLKTLEEVLGFEILERSSRPSRPAAALIKNEARLRALAADTRRLIADLRRETRQGPTQIVVASQHAITTSFAPILVDRLSRDEDLQIRLRSANLDECHAWLMTRQVDVALTYATASASSHGERTLGETALGARPLGTLDFGALDPDFVEALQIGRDRLIPVFASAEVNQLLWRWHHGELPIIAYPEDAFFGRVLSRAILPRLERTGALKPVAETALTPAALQMSKQGNGLAWIPASLAAPDLEDRTVVDLSAEFGAVDTLLIATRRRSARPTAADRLWSQLKVLAAQEGDAPQLADPWDRRPRRQRGSILDADQDGAA